MFFNRNKKLTDEIVKNESNSFIEELKSHHKRKSDFNLPYNIERCYMGVIKSSFSALKGVNWRNIKVMQIGDELKSKNNIKYKITNLKFLEIYELSCVIDGIIYWITWEFKSLKDNKTRITFTESLKHPSSLNGFRANIAKMNFNKKFEKNIKKITLAVYEEVKNLNEY